MKAAAPWSHRVLAVLTLVCLFLAIGVLIALTGTVTPSTLDTGLAEDHGSLVDRVFGSSRTVLSRHLFLEADRYFHKGIRVRARRAFNDALLIRWADQIAPTRHEEVSGERLSEIMPWLQMSIGSDPQNFDAWAAAGYWLLQQGNMTAAVDLLKEAQQKNPGDYRFFSALGQFYFFNQDYALAMNELNRARVLWPRFSRESEEDHYRGLGEVLTYQSGIYEAWGNRAAALEGYRLLQKLFPERAHLPERIAELEAGINEGDVERLPVDHEEAQQHVLQFSNTKTHVHHSGCTHE